MFVTLPEEALRYETALLFSDVCSPGMTPDLQRRLNEVQPPFDGWTASTDFIPITALRKKIIHLGEILREQGASPLFWFKDWSFHDGFPSDPKPYDWSAFDEMTASDAALEGFCVGDTFCAFAFFPADSTWFCRIEIPGPDDDPFVELGGRSGKIDLSGALPLVRRVAESVLGPKYEFEPSVRFFVPSWKREPMG